MKTFFRHSLSVHQIFTDLPHNSTPSHSLFLFVCGAESNTHFKGILHKGTCTWHEWYQAMKLLLKCKYCTLIWWSIIRFMLTQIVWCRAGWDQKTTKESNHSSLLVGGWMDEDLRCGLVRPIECFYCPENDGSPDEKCRGQSCGQGWKDEIVKVCALSDVLQDVKDKLHHDGLFTPLAPPAVNHRDKHAI